MTPAALHREAVEAAVHAICKLMRGWADRPDGPVSPCKQCPRLVPTLYGDAMRGCYAIAEEAALPAIRAYLARCAEGGWKMIEREPTYQDAQALGAPWESWSRKNFPSRFREWHDAAPPFPPEEP